MSALRIVGASSIASGGPQIGSVSEGSVLTRSGSVVWARESRISVANSEAPSRAFDEPAAHGRDHVADRAARDQQQPGDHEQHGDDVRADALEEVLEAQ